MSPSVCSGQRCLPDHSKRRASERSNATRCDALDISHHSAIAEEGGGGTERGYRWKDEGRREWGGVELGGGWVGARTLIEMPCFLLSSLPPCSQRIVNSLRLWS